ncbi:hypothetical protein PGT21_027349 [Puccinia graminis f. sp. tritici]|uniref:Uncharacterized protein n=1 Tax=Puccinia graminis f. sp. tritici TaxID=56615 RepID=A0A5B0PH84_PUCGR|nr:hypothetical protein PGT21_027349 [Puccinia graminis f. sp. tritici]
MEGLVSQQSGSKSVPPSGQVLVGFNMWETAVMKIHPFFLVRPAILLVFGSLYKKDSVNRIHTPEYHKMLFLGSNSLFLSLPLEPSVAQPISVNSIIQRNLYRHAKVELGLYLLLDCEPTETNDSLSSLSSSGHRSSSSTEDYWNDSSETSISFDEFIPAHLYTPRRVTDISEGE